MSRFHGLRGAVLAAAVLACPATPMPYSDAADTNPLVAPWTGPHGGVPPFDRVRVADLGPGIDLAIERRLAAVDAIAADPAPPTFANTLVPLERASRDFEKSLTIYEIWGSCLSDDAVQAVEREAAPKLAAMADRIFQNRRLFERTLAAPPVSVG